MPVASSDKLQINVAVNGSTVSGLVRASIVTTNCFSADTYALTFAGGRCGSMELAFWSTVSSALVEVSAITDSPNGRTYKTLITGMTDSVHIDPVRGTVAVAGRDLSSSMIDSYRQQDFVNQTASEIVSTIAQYHGLVPVVAATSGNIGRYYSDGYTKLSLGQFSRVQSDWDFMVQLARENDFDVYVQGQSLYFQPADEWPLAPIPVSIQDVQSLRIERNLNVSLDIAATVQSWNSQDMTAYNNAQAADTLLGGRDKSTSGLSFLFSGSNYTSQQVTECAERYTSELTRLGTILHIDMPWDLSLMPRAAILLLDTASPFDTTFRVDTVERQYSSTLGSKQLLRAVGI